MLLKGTIAPDFNLYVSPYRQVRLSELKGKRVILAFYPADWSPVCGDQMALYNELLRTFRDFNAVILGISVDSKWCHMAYAEIRNLGFPLLADFEPKGAVSKMYGVYEEASGECKRALFIIDETGLIQWSYLAPKDINPGADGIIDTLESLSYIIS